MWVDIVFWVLIALYGIVGLWQGLFDSILSLFGSAIAVGVGIWLAKPAAAFINKIVNMPSLFEKLLNKAFTDGATISIWNNTFDKKDMAAFLSLVFAGIIVFILVKLAIWLLAKIFDGATKKSSIASGLNKVFGLLFGIIKGGFMVCVMLALCSIITNTQIFGNSIDNAINKSTTTKWVYKYVDDFTEKQLNKIDMKKFLQDIVSNANKDNKTNTDTNAQNQNTNNSNIEIIIPEEVLHSYNVNLKF